MKSITILFQFPNYVVFLEYNEQEWGEKEGGTEKKEERHKRANKSLHLRHKRLKSER